MSVFESVMNSGVGSFIKDPTASVTSALDGLKSHPALASAGTELSAELGKMKASAASALAQLKISLPTMAAVDSMQKQIATLNGTFPGTNGGDLFKQAFAHLESAPAEMQGLLSKVQTLLANAPPPPALDPNADPSIPLPITETAATVQSLLAEATAKFSSASAAADAAVATGQAQLQNFSFASFLSGNHPPAVADIINKYFTVPPALKAEKELITASIPAMNGVNRAETVVPATSTEVIVTKPAPPEPVTTADTENFDRLRAEYLAVYEEKEAASKVCIEVQHRCEAFQDAHNYQAIKAKGIADGATEEDKQAYYTLREQYREAVYNEWKVKWATYQEILTRFAKVRQEFVYGYSKR